MKNTNPNQNPQGLRLVSLGETYRHNLRVKHWLVRKEKGFELQEMEQIKSQRLSVEHHLEKCLLLVGKNQVESKH